MIYRSYCCVLVLLAKLLIVNIFANSNFAMKHGTAYDSIVDSLNLTDNMRIALECRQNGLSYPEIAAILERAQSTVFEYFIKMRQRYMAIYG